MYLWTQQGALAAKLGPHATAVSAVAALAFPRLASGSVDGEVRVWDAATHQCVASLRGHSKMVSSIVMLPVPSNTTPFPADRFCSGAAGDKLLRVWEVFREAGTPEEASAREWAENVARGSAVRAQKVEA